MSPRRHRREHSREHLLTGSQRGTSRCVSRPIGGVGPAVALYWSLRDAGGVQGLVDESIIGCCTSLVERGVQECGREDRRGGGREECRRRDSSSVGTVDLTSARSESRQARSRLASAGTAWLPTKESAFERILLKLACAEG